MRVLEFRSGECQGIRQYLDSYVSNELMIETNHQVLKHLERCSGCTTLLEQRVYVRDRLRTAVAAQEVNHELHLRISTSLRRKRTTLHTFWSMAATLVLSLASVPT